MHATGTDRARRQRRVTLVIVALALLTGCRGGLGSEDSTVAGDRMTPPAAGADAPAGGQTAAGGGEAPGTAPASPPGATGASAAPSGPAAETVMDVIERNVAFTELLAALRTADLTDDLRADGPFTVFAPTAQGFATLQDDVRQELRRDPEDAAELLLAHVVRGRWETADLTDQRAELQTLAGTTLRVRRDAGAVITVNELAEITRPDIPAGNGVVHAIDGFVTPESAEPS